MTENGKHPQYSLAMIVRNCAEKLSRCLESYGKFPDELVIVNTGLTEDEPGFKETNSVAKWFGAKVFHFPWNGNFSDARNESFKHCTYDYVMWLDSDDTVAYPERFDQNVRSAISKGIQWILCTYLYEFDRYGNCTTSLPRERVVFKSAFRWKAPLHECLCADYELPGAMIPEDGGHIVHDQIRDNVAEYEKKLTRNLNVLEGAFPDGKADPRMMFYWGNTLIGLKRFDEAIAKYKEYLSIEPNKKAQHCYVAYVSMSEAYRMLLKYDEATEYALKAVAWDPTLPTGWLQAAESAMCLGDYQRAISLANEVFVKGKNVSGEMIFNPTAITVRPHFVTAFSCARLGRLDEAVTHAQKFLEKVKDDLLMEEIVGRISSLEDLRRTREEFLKTKDKLEKAGQHRLVSPLAKIFSTVVPPDVTYHRHIPKERVAGKRSIAFYCPGGLIDGWGHDGVEKGTGGSEEAVINMAWQFRDLGWAVEVYAPTKKPGIHDGVRWFHHQQWSGDGDTPTDVVVWWRCPSMPRQVGGHTRLNYLWLHDMLHPAVFHDGSAMDYDGIFLLSKYHREAYRGIPDEKVILSQNGLQEELFQVLENHDPKVWIWGSDPSRGLDRILRHWPWIREQIPDLKLKVFYGWSSNLLEDRFRNPALMQAYTMIEGLRNQEGVEWCGRVGQKRLAQEYANAGVWVYPTSFTEISCITAMKAQAHGCIPVCTDAFALSETVTHGYRFALDMNDDVNVKTLLEKAVWVSQNYEAARAEINAVEMVEKAREQTWGKVARQWESRFSTDLQRSPHPIRREGEIWKQALVST